MKGYKAFNKDWTCRDFQYEIGKTYELAEGEKLKMCKCGFHFCANPIDVFGYYPMDGETKIAVIEALGNIEQEGTKFCTDKIRIIKEFTPEQLQALILDGNYNSGNYNSGYYNSGMRNSGNCNSGNGNSGNCNSGNCNSGMHNSGYYNSGMRNSGHWNSGDWNSGNWNSGRHNSGNCNSGNWNSGNYNSGNYNSGIFNTNEPKLRAFNREYDMTRSEWLNALDYNFCKLCCRINDKTLIDGDEEKIKALPNFDADIFEEITGIKIE